VLLVVVVATISVACPLLSLAAAAANCDALSLSAVCGGVDAKRMPSALIHTTNTRAVIIPATCIACVGRSCGALLRYLPPYSPDFNPIEPGWRLVKKRIRAAAPRTRTALRRVAQSARRRVSPMHCLRWTRHAGSRRGFK